MEDKEVFEAALNALPPQKSDIILVLRNWDEDENRARVELGVRLLTSGWASTLVLCNASDTADEARAVSAFVKTGGSILLVTHQYHSYRAYLTFVKWMKEYNVRLSIKCLPSGKVLGEADKIEQYSKKGDCATYEEGLEYLKWLK